MADYYTKGIVKLTLIEEQIIWAHKVLEEACKYLRLLSEGRITELYEYSLSKEAQIIVEDLVGVYPTYDIFVENGSLLVWDDSDFETEVIARWVKVVLNQFNIETPVSFQYIRDCNKARPDAYGGGAVVVTKHRITTFDLDKMVACEIAELKEVNELYTLIEYVGGDVLDKAMAENIESLGTDLADKNVLAWIEYHLSLGWSAAQIKEIIREKVFSKMSADEQKIITG